MRLTTPLNAFSIGERTPCVFYQKGKGIVGGESPFQSGLVNHPLALTQYPFEADVRLDDTFTTTFLSSPILQYRAIRWHSPKSFRSRCKAVADHSHGSDVTAVTKVGSDLVFGDDVGQIPNKNGLSVVVFLFPGSNIASDMFLVVSNLHNCSCGRERSVGLSHVNAPRKARRAAENDRSYWPQLDKCAFLNRNDEI
jgi:hypothetical protein